MNHSDDCFSDKAVVTRILNGNIQDYALVVTNTEKLVTQIVRKMITDESKQKDLVQDIYLKAYQHLSSFQFKSKLSTWIAQIAYNTTVNYLEKKRIPIIELGKIQENTFGIADDSEWQAIKAEEREILHVAITQLPPLYSTLITLYHLEELSNKEISEITNLPEGTIKSYLFRARKILKDAILQHYK